MDIGLFTPLVVPPVTPPLVKELGQAAESRGYHTIWLGEHVVTLDTNQSTYPYTEDGRMPAVGPRDGLPEQLTTLAYLAACTSSIRLGTGITILPQRNPVVLAKELANIDWLSGGRLSFGVGLGWLREEYEALQAPWAGRANRCRDYVQVLKTLWEDDLSQVHTPSYDLAPSQLFPKPVQQPHPPILFGGESDAALARVAELGQGWYGFSLTPAELAPRLDALDRALDARGRSRAEVRIVASPYMKRIDEADFYAYAEAGVDELVLPLFVRDAGEMHRRLERMESRVRPFIGSAAQK